MSLLFNMVWSPCSAKSSQESSPAFLGPSNKTQQRHGSCHILPELNSRAIQKSVEGSGGDSLHLSWMWILMEISAFLLPSKALPFSSLGPILINPFVQLLSRAWPSVTPQTVAQQTALSMGFPRLEWAAISSSRGFSRPRDWTLISCRPVLYHWATREAHNQGLWERNPDDIYVCRITKRDIRLK